MRLANTTLKRIRATMEAGMPPTDGDGAVLAATDDDDDAFDDDHDSAYEMAHHDGSPQVRSIAITRWLSTPEVTSKLGGTPLSFIVIFMAICRRDDN